MRATTLALAGIAALGASAVAVEPETRDPRETMHELTVKFIHTTAPIEGDAFYQDLSTMVVVNPVDWKAHEIVCESAVGEDVSQFVRDARRGVASQ